MKKILLINGPNINLLGTRQKDIYGSNTLKDLENLCNETASALKIDLTCKQTNSESDIIELIQNAEANNFAGIIINAAAFSHTSIAILDALLAVKIPKIEVHISNICKRDSFRNNSYVSKATDGVIMGLGFLGYVCALYAIENLTK